MPRLNIKNKILTEFTKGTINNQTANKFKVTREYIRQIRTRYQNSNVENLLDKINQTIFKITPLEYNRYRFLIDAKLVRIESIDFLKNRRLVITPLGLDWLAYLRQKLPADF